MAGGSPFTTATVLTASEIVFWVIEEPSLGRFDGRMKSHGSCGCGVRCCVSCGVKRPLAFAFVEKNIFV